MLCSKGIGQGQGRVKRRRLASPTAQLSTSQGDEGGCSVTPPGGFVSVCMEEVATRMSHLKIQGGGARVVSESPKTRKRGTLQKRQLFPSSKRHALLPPWSLSEILALVSFVLFHTEGNTWPSRHGDDAFRDDAGRFVQSCCATDFCRTGEL